MIAKVRRAGTISRKSSTRLPTRSVACTDSPVTLPPDARDWRPGRCQPGQMRLRRRSGSAAWPASRNDCASRCHNNIDFQSDEFSRQLGETLAASVGPAILDCDGAALDPAELAQPPDKGHYPWFPSRGCCHAENADRRQLAALLRTCRERPRRRRAAEQRHELAASCMSRKEHCEG